MEDKRPLALLWIIGVPGSNMFRKAAKTVEDRKGLFLKNHKPIHNLKSIIKYFFQIHFFSVFLPFFFKFSSHWVLRGATDLRCDI